MISVCIATYNGSKYIKEQLNSILSQLQEDDEVIISDDSSTDNTINIIESLNDSRIHILKDNKFHSTIFNIENAILHSKGDYIFLSDQDDVWCSNKVEKCLEKLKEYDCVVSDAIIVDSNLNVINKSFFEVNRTHSGFLYNLMKNGFIGACMVFNASLKKKVLPFPNDIPMHDSWIGLNAYKCGKVLFIKEPLILYRRHGNNVSQSGEKSKYSISMKILFRVRLIINLILRWFI